MSKSKPIVGMILDSDFPPDPRVENEALILINSGFEVHLFAFSYEKNFQQRETYKGIEVHRYYCSPLLFKLSALAYTVPFYHWWVKRAIRRFVCNTGCDLVHIHDIQVARAVYYVQKSTPFKVILDLHENRPEIMKHYKHVNQFPGRLFISPSRWKSWEERLVKQADGVVVVTEAARDDLQRRTGYDRIAVAPNVVDKNYAVSYINQEVVEKYANRFVLLYLGDTSERRGILTAIEGLRELIPTIDNLMLVVVGKSSFDEELKARADKLEVSDYIDFTGWQDATLFPSYIRAAHVGISPLYRNLHHDTTYANKLFQYMALGCTLLVSDCTAQQQLVEETQSGLAFKEKSVTDFVGKVKTLYNNTELRTQMGKNGRKAVAEKYNWEYTGRQLVDFYQQITKR